jgi:hypothetical protein
VHLNGKAVRSCLTPVSAAANQPILTIEGLSPDGTHPLQVAWEPQAGQIIAARFVFVAFVVRFYPLPALNVARTDALSFFHRRLLGSFRNFYVASNPLFFRCPAFLSFISVQG